MTGIFLNLNGLLLGLPNRLPFQANPLKFQYLTHDSPGFSSRSVKYL
ncbi:hypothetical protein M153_3000006843 [Pseudoloma neurophilia]|uniref:Uncharacterized protein n=1 Tax=Pseudoloma neurophilia TaxID=146866 RepID=A0A0R0LYF5_9MICR|nr:hypothetical protein M153_3000006843 [Pseudoloma neurophilia]